MYVCLYVYVRLRFACLHACNIHTQDASLFNFLFSDDEDPGLHSAQKQKGREKETQNARRGEESLGEKIKSTLERAASIFRRRAPRPHALDVRCVCVCVCVCK